MTKDTDRHSEPVVTAEHKPLSPEERAPIEAANGLRQFDRLVKILEGYLDGLKKEGKEAFAVRPSMIMELNRIAVDKLIANPGGYRHTPMAIRTSAGVVKHQPPPHEEVAYWVDEMCEYVNQNWNKPAIHLAAYLLWRVNWIHPFSDGNGRTARAISYLVLCVRLRQRLPGDRTMPEFISDEKSPYYKGLEAADDAYLKNRTIDVSALEGHLQDLLVKQVTRAASTGTQAVVVPAPPPKRDVDAIAEALGQLTAATHTNKPSRTTPWIAAGAVLIAATITGMFAISQCGKEARCTPGAQQACRCSGGVTGFQVCATDGLTYSPCDCGVTAPSGSGAGVRPPPSGSGAGVQPVPKSGSGSGGP